tara:strand:- start:2046 stop:2219 length:174 start_codon:yes stop_codon:yes gene_type:complete
MTAKIINFYTHWKAKQEIRRKSIGYPADLWYMMLEGGYEPTNSDDVKEFIKDLEDNE